MNRFAYSCIYIILIYKVNSIYSQSVENAKYSINDSLKNKSYTYLYTNFYKNRNNDTLYDLYSQEYLKKAYREEDTSKIAWGYFAITNKKKDKYFSLYDSLIKYATLTDDYEMLWKAHYRRGSYFSDKRQFKKALTDEIKAYNIARKHNYPKYIDRSSTSLGIIKEKIGRNKDALKDFRRNYLYKDELINRKPFAFIFKSEGISYLNSLHLLSNSYRLNGKLDSADVLNKKAQKFRKFDWSKNEINKIRLNAAEVHYDKEQYENAIDSAKSAIPEFIIDKNLKSVAVCYYVLGMAHLKLGHKEEGIGELKKMDSIYSILGHIYPAARPGYDYLRKYYEEMEDTKKQLYYVEQLLRFDSIAHSNYSYITEEIVDKIDKPNLIEQQKQLKEELAETSKISRISYIVGSCCILLLIAEIYRRRYIINQKNREKEQLHEYYKEKFDVLIKQNNIATSEHQKSLSATEITSESTSDKLGISDDVINALLKALRIFEDKKLFVDADLTATSLAKDFGTNANYLGKIVKFQYQKSFRNYVNDLRLDLALDKLRNDKSFKNYSVQAMANEVGFKNAEPFSKAFKNRTGFYPSEFVNQLN